jgi:hypothetical protein
VQPCRTPGRSTSAALVVALNRPATAPIRHPVRIPLLKATGWSYRCAAQIWWR